MNTLARLIALAFLLLLPDLALAEVSSSTQALIDEAKKSGSTVIVITPPAAAAPAAAPVPSDTWQDGVERTLDEMRRVASGWGTLTRATAVAMRSHGADGTSAWFGRSLVAAMLSLAIGAALALVMQRWMYGRLTRIFHTPPASRAERLSRLYGLAGARLLLLVIMLLGAIIPAAAFGFESTGWRVTLTGVLLAAAMIGVMWIVDNACFAPREPHLRVAPFSEAEARRLFWDMTAASTLGVVFLVVWRWMLQIGVSPQDLKPGLILAIIGVAVMFGAVALRNRYPIGRLIAGDPAQGGGQPWRQSLAKLWPVIAVTYLVLATLVAILRVVLGLPHAVGVVTTPIVAALVGFAVYGLALIVIDGFVARQERKAAARAAEETHGPAVDPTYMRNLLQRSAALVSLAIAFFLLARLWGLDTVFGADISAAAVEIVIVLIAAFFAYQAAKLWIDRKIAMEKKSVEATGLPPETVPSSRLATLLPLFRNFLLATICAIAVMIVLSRLGVSIGPLLAGAGVVGVAVGFGSQTLVKDIISGAFYLADDAFRVGEYIDIGSAKGTVEHILIRSMQLRHQNGPLCTIPFGAITKVNNFSRDWTITKLPLRVTYETDVEKVRKLIKKLGQELLSDPEIGNQFLAPLKSQGIYAMEDSAMIIRVKFTTKPGDQATIRRVVYARIRELFQKEGIKFANREVRVHVAEDADEGQRKSAMAAAARAVLDDADARAANAA